MSLNFARRSIFAAFVRHLLYVQVAQTPIQLPAAVADPEVRILFGRRTFFTNLTIAMAAIAASDAFRR